MAQQKDAYVEAIRRLAPIDELNEGAQQELIAAAELVSLRKGKFLFEQGDEDDFVFYLLEGELEFTAQGQLIKRLTGGTDEARERLAQLQPRQLSARARTPVVALRLSRAQLDDLAAAQRDGRAAGVEVSIGTDGRDDEGESVDWMMEMLSSDLFSRLPPANIQTVFTRMEAFALHAGETVACQGEVGDHFFVISEGRCELSRSPPGGKPVRLARLGPGQSFGAETLISGKPAETTATMSTDGVLMRLAKKDFLKLMATPVLTAVSAADAESLVSGGASWLDVRHPREHQASGIAGSINLPLGALRLETGRLEGGKHYIVCSDSVASSAAGAFLLIEAGHQTSYLGESLRAVVESAAKSAEPAPQAIRGEKAAKRHEPAAGGANGAAARAPSQPVTAEPLASDQAGARRVASDAERKAAEERATLRAENERLRKEIAQLEEARTKAEQALEAAEVKWRERCEGLQRSRAELERRKNQAVTAEQAAQAALARGADAVAESERAHQEAETEWRDRYNALRQQLSESERLRDETAAEIEKTLESLNSANQRLETEVAAAAEARSEVARLSDALEAARGAVEAEQKRKEAQQRELDRLQREAQERLAEQTQRVQAERTDHEAARAEVERLREEVEAHIQEQRAGLEAESEAIDKRREEVERLAAQADAERKDAEQLGATRQRELDARAAALAEREQAFKVELATELERRMAEERGISREEIERGREELGRARDALAEAKEARRNAQESAREAALALEVQKAALADAQAAMRKDRAQLSEETKRLRIALSAAERRGEELARAVESAKAQAAAAPPPPARRPKPVAEPQDRGAQLIAELEAAMAEAGMDTGSPKKASAAPPPAADAENRVIDPKMLKIILKKRAEVDQKRRSLG